MSAPFTTVAGLAIPLPVANVDTDTIIRIEHLLDNGRAALREHGFAALRLRADGSEDPACALNQADLAHAPILVAGRNFGCGSSREHAVWALEVRGIRVVIAASFGDIFVNNCYQNGVLPVTLEAPQVDALLEEAQARRPLTVSLLEQRITTTDQRHFAFSIGPWQRQRLLSGGDDIALTLADRAAIDAWQRHDRGHRPWIWSAHS
ncbi:MAG: 3-isopropylmalate dehydratase small subunit [Gammaproteobacteria bacterium]|nr:3-isopropylmalate dehydratase small subunit [Gammaproteobacteria bacterium]